MVSNCGIQPHRSSCALCQLSQAKRGQTRSAIQWNTAWEKARLCGKWHLRFSRWRSCLWVNMIPCPHVVLCTARAVAFHRKHIIKIFLASCSSRSQAAVLQAQGRSPQFRSHPRVMHVHTASQNLPCNLNWIQQLPAQLVLKGCMMLLWTVNSCSVSAQRWVHFSGGERDRWTCCINTGFSLQNLGSMRWQPSCSPVRGVLPRSLSHPYHYSIWVPSNSQSQHCFPLCYISPMC